MDGICGDMPIDSLEISENIWLLQEFVEHEDRDVRCER